MIKKYRGYIVQYRDFNPAFYIGSYTVYLPNMKSLILWLVKNCLKKRILKINRGVVYCPTDSRGHAVCDLEYEGNGDGTAYIIAATYWDTGEPVEDGELEYLTDAYPELCDEWAMESAIGAAEAWGDMLRGH